MSRSVVLLIATILMLPAWSSARNTPSSWIVVTSATDLNPAWLFPNDQSFSVGDPSPRYPQFSYVAPADGSDTGDDTVAIRRGVALAAIQFANADLNQVEGESPVHQGAVLYFPPGTYRVSETIALYHVHVRGAGVGDGGSSVILLTDVPELPTGLPQWEIPAPHEFDGVGWEHTAFVVTGNSAIEDIALEATLSSGDAAQTRWILSDGLNVRQPNALSTTASQASLGQIPELYPYDDFSPYRRLDQSPYHPYDSLSERNTCGFTVRAVTTIGDIGEFYRNHDVGTLLKIFSCDIEVGRTGFHFTNNAGGFELFETTIRRASSTQMTGSTGILLNLDVDDPPLEPGAFPRRGHVDSLTVMDCTVTGFQDGLLASMVDPVVTPGRVEYDHPGFGGIGDDLLAWESAAFFGVWLESVALLGNTYGVRVEDEIATSLHVVNCRIESEYAGVEIYSDNPSGGVEDGLNIRHLPFFWGNEISGNTFVTPSYAVRFWNRSVPISITGNTFLHPDDVQYRGDAFISVGGNRTVWVQRPYSPLRRATPPLVLGASSSPEFSSYETYRTERPPDPANGRPYRTMRMNSTVIAGNTFTAPQPTPSTNVEPPIFLIGCENVTVTGNTVNAYSSYRPYYRLTDDPREMSIFCGTMPYAPSNLHWDNVTITGNTMARDVVFDPVPGTNSDQSLGPFGYTRTVPGFVSDEFNVITMRDF